MLAYDPAGEAVTKVWKPSGTLGMFGIAHSVERGLVIVASRERRGRFLRGKHSSDVRLYGLHPRTLEVAATWEVPDVHDVHQIELLGEMVFLTDTGLNRIVCYDLAGEKVTRIVNLGPERKDVHHVNALLLQGTHLWVGLNNRAHRDAELLRLPLELVTGAHPFEVDGMEEGETVPLPGIVHTHDLEPYQGTFLSTASKDGFVFRTDSREQLLRLEGWVRGIAVTEEQVWVSISTVAERSRRHEGDLGGKIVGCHPATFEQETEIPLPGVGQLCDLLAL